MCGAALLCFITSVNSFGQVSAPGAAGTTSAVSQASFTELPEPAHTGKVAEVVTAPATTSLSDYIKMQQANNPSYSQLMPFVNQLSQPGLTPEQIAAIQNKLAHAEQQLGLPVVTNQNLTASEIAQAQIQSIQNQIDNSAASGLTKAQIQALLDQQQALQTQVTESAGSPPGVYSIPTSTGSYYSTVPGKN